MRTVVLDSNALFFPFQFNVDLEAELRAILGGCRVMVPEVVIRELKGLVRGGKQNASAALRYAERFEVLPDDSGLKGDEGVLAAALKVDGVLVSSDRALIKRAREKGLKVIFLRERQRLDMK